MSNAHQSPYYEYPEEHRYLSDRLCVLHPREALRCSPPGMGGRSPCATGNPSGFCPGPRRHQGWRGHLDFHVAPGAGFGGNQWYSHHRHQAGYRTHPRFLKATSAGSSTLPTQGSMLKYDKNMGWFFAPLLLVGLILLVVLFQGRFIYFPLRYSPAELAEAKTIGLQEVRFRT